MYFGVICQLNPGLRNFLYHVLNLHFVTYVRKKFNCLMTVLVITSDILCRTASALNVDGFSIVHIELDFLAVDPIIDCKYLPPLLGVSRKSPQGSI